MLIALFWVAFFYASVGHGGASGYLALMALFGVAPDAMKSSALLLNLLVSSVAFIQYYRNGFFRWNLFWPFACTSVPAAFAGSLIDLDDAVYRKILGVLLLVSVIRLVAAYREPTGEPGTTIPGIAWAAGLVIGLLSGMIGIGGGILLSPILLFLHLASMKETAAVSSLFIFVNSLAGLAGVMYTNYVWSTDMVAWSVIALAGGIAGSWLGSTRMNTPVMKWTLALVLLVASMKLFLI